MIRDFGLNTNFLETNILNLSVVVRVVIVFVGDAVSVLLAQRRNNIIRIFTETEQDTKRIDIKVKCRTETRVIAHKRAIIIRNKIPEWVEQEKCRVQRQLELDIYQFQEKRNQAFEIVRQQSIQQVANKIFNLAFISAEKILIQNLQSKKLIYSKQKALNEIYLQRLNYQSK